jgi:hypothetical protein
MTHLGKLGSLVATFGSIRSKQRCFALATEGRDGEALQLIARTRAVTRNNPLASWEPELQLLEGYLLLESGELSLAQRALSGVFSQIKRSRHYNDDERAILIRYGVSVLWHVRGRNELSCLLRIRHARAYDRTKVSGWLLNSFPNPDEAG